MSNICQSFQTLYEASPIINVTHRSFAVFHPIMYVTHRSFAAPAPAIRDFFRVIPYIYSLLRGGFYNASSGFGLWAKTLRGQLLLLFLSTNIFILTQRILPQITYFTYSTAVTILTITYLSYLQNSIYITYNAQYTKYTKLPMHALLYNTVLKETT